MTDMNIIPLTGTTLAEFTPDELAKGFNPKPVFYLRTPTFQMRDRIAALLYQRGFIPATPQQGRSVLIDALYDLYLEQEAEDHATFLESFWTRQELHNEILQAWSIREAQRLFDLAQGVKATKDRPMEQEPMPPAPYSVRETSRHAKLVSDAMTRHDGYRAFQGRLMTADVEEREMIVRIFLDHWEGCGDVPAERDEMDRLTLASMEGVRGWLQENGAHNAWRQVESKITLSLGAPGGLEKNFDSPLDTNSSLTGSQIPSGDLGISDGSSTTSSTSPTPDSESPATSGASRNSRSARTGSKKKTGRTGGRS